MNFINKNFKWISLGGNILAFISLFLPFASVSASVLGISINKSVAYIDGDGVIILFALVAASILLFIKNIKFTLIPLGICLVVTFYDIINLGSSMGQIIGSYGNMIKVSLGIGFYLFILGLIASIGSMVYANFIMKKLNVAVKQPVNQVPVQNQEPVMQMNEVPTQEPVVEPVMVQETIAETTQETVVEAVPVQEQVTEVASEPKELYCTSCGAKQNPNSKFCEFCGNKLN